MKAEDWAPFRAKIEELHIHQNRPLPEVKLIIEIEVGFKAEYACLVRNIKCTS